MPLGESTCAPLPSSVIIKHNNPCGVALVDGITHAYEKALSSDPVSAFGSVVVVNRVVEEELAQSLSSNLVEGLFAPGYLEEALEIMVQKKGMRIIVDQERRRSPRGMLDMRRVLGGVLLQDWDSEVDEREGMEVLTTRQPSEEEWGDLLFSW